MGISKKKDWIKWIRKNFAGILDSKTGSMETLIDSGSARTVNYVYTGSSVIADDEELVGVATTTATATAAADLEVPPPHRRPMLPPPLASQDSPSAPNDVYDCCVSLDGIPIKHEFQYTLSDTDGYGKITKNDVEGLASKILESMYGTTANFSCRGQRTVKVTLSVRQSAAAVAAAALDDGDGLPSSWNYLPLQQQQQKQQQQQVGRERRSRSSADKVQRYYGKIRTVAAEADDWGPGPLESQVFPIYREFRVSSPPPPQQQQQQQQHNRRDKSGAQRYRRDQLIEMVQKSLAENLSFQNQRKSNRPEDYHRVRTKRRQSSAFAGAAPALQLQSTPLPAPPPSSAVKPKGPPKVAWSPYDFETPSYVPSYHHHEKLKNTARNNHQQQQPFLYYSFGDETAAVDVPPQVKQSSGGGRRQQHHHHRSAGGAVVDGNNTQKPKDRVALQEQTKNVDHQKNKRAKLAKKTYHVHEHHHYHHYNYMV